MNLQWSIAKKIRSLDILLLFFIAMNGPTIYIYLLDRHVLGLTCIHINM